MINYISPLPGEAWNKAAPRTLCILGSTGSIGVNCLRVVDAHPGRFHIAALAAGRNVELLARQAALYRPRWLGVQDEESAAALKPLLPQGYEPVIEVGPHGYARLAALGECSTVVGAQVGKAGLIGAVSAALAGKVICLANKESLVLAGDLLRRICHRTGAIILPVDSEHNALFQCIYRRTDEVKKLIITASGGPFRGKDITFLETVTPAMALKHPNWKMGAKVTIDSASLMNKGLEVIEAHHLYGVPVNDIGVFVHPQSIVHAMAEFRDGSVFAHMGMPDMRMPIAHCMLWPDCQDVGVAPLDLAAIGSLTFERPDMKTFPCLGLACMAMAAGTEACVAMNAANEVAVPAFLNGRIRFTEIPQLITEVMTAARSFTLETGSLGTSSIPSCLSGLAGAHEAFAALALVDAIDNAARHEAERIIENR